MRCAIGLALVTIAACSASNAPTSGTPVAMATGDAGTDANALADADSDAAAVADAAAASDAPRPCLSPSWSHAYGQGSVSQETTISGLAIDAAGNTYLAGLFTDDVDFGGGAIHAGGLAATYVAKLDPAGDVAWATRFGGSGEVQALGIAVAKSGDRVVVTGTFTGSATFGSDAATLSATDEDVFLVALDGASGAPAWARSFGGNGPDHGLGVGVADDGSIAASGSFTASIDFGDGAHASASPDGAAFVTKVGRDGATQWSRAWDGLVVGSNALAMSGAGAVAFTGFAGSPIDFGGGQLPNAGGKDVVVAELDASGNHVYSASFGGPGDQYGYGAALAGDGALVFTGGYEMAIDFGQGPLGSPGAGPDVFVAEVDPQGKIAWGVSGRAGAFGVSAAIGGDGRVFVLEDLREVNGNTPFSGASLRSIAADGHGAFTSFALEGKLDSLGERAVAAPSGDVVLGGTFSGDLVVCGGAALHAGAGEVRTYLVDLAAGGVR